MPVIEFKNISKSYDGLKVLNEVSGSLEKGEVASLIGRNGAGKTTLLEILFGLRTPDSGEVSILGIDPSKNPEELRQKVALVSENCTMYPYMNAPALESFLKPLYKKWDSKIYEQMLKRFSIPTETTIKDMSKGNKHKLMLASALATQPEVLLLDEPLSGFDAVIREEVLETLITSLCESGMTIIISSHQIEEIAQVSESAFFLVNHGFKISGKISEIENSVRKVAVRLEENLGTVPTDQDILFTKSEGKELELVVQNFSEEKLATLLSGLKVKSKSSARIGLKDLFIKLTKNTSEL